MRSKHRYRATAHPAFGVLTEHCEHLVEWLAAARCFEHRPTPMLYELAQVMHFEVLDHIGPDTVQAIYNVSGPEGLLGIVALYAECLGHHVDLRPDAFNKHRPTFDCLTLPAPIVEPKCPHHRRDEACPLLAALALERCLVDRLKYRMNDLRRRQQALRELRQALR